MGTVTAGLKSATSYELRVVRSLLDQVAQDGGALVLSGDPGTGKTRLLAAAAQAASRAGMKVVRAGGAVFEADIGFAGLHQLLVPLQIEMAALPCPARSALNVTLGMGNGPAPDRLVVLNSVLALLRQAARQVPLLLVVDDLHWIDEPSAAALGFVARRLVGSRVGLLAAMRSDSDSCITSFGLPALQLPSMDGRPGHDRWPSRQRVSGPSLHAAMTAATSQLNDGEVDSAHRMLLAAIERASVRADDETQGLVEALYPLGVACHFSGRPELLLTFSRLLRRLGDAVPPVLRHATDIWSDPSGAPPATLISVQRASALLDGDQDPWLTLLLGLVAPLVDNWTGCHGPLRRALYEALEQDRIDWAVGAGILLAFDAYGRGDWTEAEQLARDSITLSEAHGHQLYAWKGRYLLALIAACRGDWDTCQVVTEEMMTWAEPRGVQGIVQDARHVRARAALGQGDFDAAFLEASNTCSVDSHALRGSNFLRGSLDLVESAARTHRDAAAQAHVEAVGMATINWMSPRLALRRAAVAAFVAPDDMAQDLFQGALDIPGIEKWPFDVARVQLAFGERLRRLRATGASRTQLTAAVEGFTRLGARPWAERAGDELRATGARRRRHDGAAATPLTPQERGIAELAATGLTNKQIGIKLYLSPRTVSAHLYRIFPKLGITTRAALRDALRALPSGAQAS